MGGVRIGNFGTPDRAAETPAAETIKYVSCLKNIYLVGDLRPVSLIKPIKIINITENFNHISMCRVWI